MAQFAGMGFAWDEVWEEKTNACLALLREAADIFSARGSAAIEAEDVVAALVWILAVPVPRITSSWTRPRWPMRYFDGSEPAPPPPIESCQKLAPRRLPEECLELIGGLKDVLGSAAGEWALGDPENPKVRRVLESLLASLWSCHFTRYPPSKEYPLGI
jgi:hypothetical protein